MILNILDITDMQNKSLKYWDAKKNLTLFLCWILALSNLSECVSPKISSTTEERLSLEKPAYDKTNTSSHILLNDPVHIFERIRIL